MDEFNSKKERSGYGPDNGVGGFGGVPRTTADVFGVSDSDFDLDSRVDVDSIYGPSDAEKSVKDRYTMMGNGLGSVSPYPPENNGDDEHSYSMMGDSMGSVSRGFSGEHVSYDSASDRGFPAEEVACTPSQPAAGSSMDIDAVVDRIRSEVNEEIIRSMRDVTVHNEEFFRKQSAEAESRLAEGEQKQVVQLAKLFEKYILTNNYCSSLNDLDAVLARYKKFEKDFERVFSQLGIEVGSVSIGDNALDADVDDKIDIQFEKKADEAMWNRIAEFRDAHYYIYKGQVVKRQVVGIYRDEDRS